MDEQELANALSRLLKRLSDKGWIESIAIKPGRLDVRYTSKGKNRMEQLKAIFVKELNVTLKHDEFRALVALLLQFDDGTEPASQ